jgi:hypothetical protein
MVAILAVVMAAPSRAAETVPPQVVPGDKDVPATFAKRLKAAESIAVTLNADTQPGDTALTPVKEVVEPLTNESLGKMLEQLGMSPKSVVLSDAITAYDMSIARSTWTISMRVALTHNREYIWMLVSCAEVNDPAAVSSGYWHGLVLKNYYIAPHNFFFDPVAKMLMLGHGERNLNITPALLRTWIDAAADTTIATYDVWKVPEMKTDVAPPAPQ